MQTAQQQKNITYIFKKWVNEGWPAVRRQRQAVFKTSLLYKVSSKSARTVTQSKWRELKKGKFNISIYQC